MIAHIRETPFQSTTSLVTGHFRRGAGYAAFRSEGSSDWLLIYTVSGKGRFGYGTAHGILGETITQTGDIVLLRPGTLHSYGVEKSLGRWELVWTHFQPKPAWHDFLHWPAAIAGFAGLMRLRLTRFRRRVHRRFLDVNRLANGAQRRRIDLAQNALEEVLLWCDASKPGAGSTDPRIQAAMDAICADLRKPLNVSDVAEIAGLSLSRFAHLFRQTVGTPPQRWIELQRLNRACQLLGMTSLSIKEVAAEVGFDDPFYFSARFRRRLGQSPKAFRAERKDASA